MWRRNIYIHGRPLSRGDGMKEILNDLTDTFKESWSGLLAITVAAVMSIVLELSR